MDDRGFPPRPDIFKVMAQELTVENAEETGDPTRAKRGQSWPSSIPNRHPKVSGKFGSNPDRQRALAVSPGLIIDFFKKLKVSKEGNFLPENSYNMDERGPTPGRWNRSCFFAKLEGVPPE